MRKEYLEYTLEHPEEMEGVLTLLQRSDRIQMERQERIERKLALIQLCREEIERNEAHNKRS